MTDLSHETRWCCLHYYEWRTREDDFLKPDCTWNQDIDGGEPVRRGSKLRCPKCGGNVVAYRVAV
jgi:hypothetical protein